MVPHRAAWELYSVETAFDYFMLVLKSIYRHQQSGLTLASTLANTSDYCSVLTALHL